MNTNLSTHKSFALLNHALFSVGGIFARYFVYGDGSCLFHAIAFALNYREYRTVISNQQQRNIGIMFRKHIIVQNEWNKFIRLMGFENIAPSFKEVASDCYFADDFLHNFVARRLRTAIIVLNSMEDMYFTHDMEHLPDNFPIILVAWIGEIHFEPIVKTQNISADAVRPNRFNNRVCDNTNTLQMQSIFCKRDPIIQNIIMACKKTTPKTKAI